MPFTPPPDDYIQHSKLRDVKIVNFEYIYDPKKNDPLGIIDSMGLSVVKRNLDNDLTEAILKRVGLSNIDDFVYALTDIKIKNKSLSKSIEFKLGQQSRYTGKNNDPNLFIADEDNENNITSVYNRESTRPYEFFTEEYLDGPAGKNIFDSALLREALENHQNTINIPQNKNEVRVTFTIRIFPFKTTVKKFGPVHLVFVNDAFQTISEGRFGLRYGKHAYKIVEQFFEDSPVTITSPLLIYFFNSARGRKSFFIPYDSLSPTSHTSSAIADAGSIDRNFLVPSRSFFTNGVRTETYNLSVTGPGSNLNKFTPLSVQKDGANSISGRNALIATYTAAKRLSRASRTGADMNSLEPGGIAIINFFVPGANYVLLHEILHILTQYHRQNTLTTNVSKLLKDPTERYETGEKSDDYAKLYGNWSQALPSFTYPSFDLGHPRPYRKIEPDDHKLAMSTMLVLRLGSSPSGGAKIYLVPVDISQTQSYGAHPLSTQVLGYMEMLLLTSDQQSAFKYLRDNRPDVVYEFYIFAAAVLINVEANKRTYLTDKHDISHFISKNSTYINNLSKIKETESYAFLDLLNKGVDDLHDSFADDISLKQMKEKLEDFKKARQKEYELSYEDFTANNSGLSHFLPLDGDFLKLNNSMANKPSNFDELFQEDFSENAGENITSSIFFNHQHPAVLLALGFEIYEETVDGKLEGKIIEVYNGEPVQERENESLVSGSVKKHRLIISRARHSNVAQLELEHRKNTPLGPQRENMLLKSLYGAARPAKRLAFSKTDGSGDESKYVYVLVSDINGNGKTNLDVSKKTITDDIGVSMDIE